MFEAPDTSQSAELTPAPLPYGRHYGAKIPYAPKVKHVVVKSRDQNLFKRPVYLCPELGQTCSRPGAYDAFALPSLFGADRKPNRFQD